MEEWADDAATMLDRVTGSPMGTAVDGRIHIQSVSEPSGRSRFQDCRVEVAVDGPGIAPAIVTVEVVLDRRHWPAAGTVLPARISRSDPRVMDVDWDRLARRSPRPPAG